jgi:hypothetical protein
VSIDFFYYYIGCFVLYDFELFYMTANKKKKNRGLDIFAEFAKNIGNRTERERNVIYYEEQISNHRMK